MTDSRFKDTTPAELAIASAHMQAIREELMNHAHGAAINAGFADRHVRFITVIGTLIGAAQLYALSDKGGAGMYHIYQAMAVAMGQTSAKDLVTRKLTDLGPEMFEGSTILKP